QVRVTRIVHRRLRYRRRCQCPGPRTVIAPPAPNPVPKGRFTAGFLARLLYQKYVLGLPVHRIARALAADGLDVAEGTISGALKAVADLLVPLDDAIGARNAEAVHVHADETSWRVFEQVEGKDGHRWWLWCSSPATRSCSGWTPPAPPPSWNATSASTAPTGRSPKAGACCSRQTSTPPTSPWPAWKALTRCGAGPTSAGTSSAPATPISSCGTGVTSGSPGSLTCTWLIRRWPPPSPPPRSTPRRKPGSSRRWPPSTPPAPRRA